MEYGRKVEVESQLCYELGFVPQVHCKNPYTGAKTEDSFFLLSMRLKVGVIAHICARWCRELAEGVFPLANTANRERTICIASSTLATWSRGGHDTGYHAVPLQQNPPQKTRAVPNVFNSALTQAYCPHGNTNPNGLVPR